MPSSIGTTTARLTLTIIAIAALAFLAGAIGIPSPLAAGGLVATFLVAGFTCGKFHVKREEQSP